MKEKTREWASGLNVRNVIIMHQRWHIYRASSQDTPVSLADALPPTSVDAPESVAVPAPLSDDGGVAPIDVEGVGSAGAVKAGGTLPSFEGDSLVVGVGSG